MKLVGLLTVAACALLVAGHSPGRHRAPLLHEDDGNRKITRAAECTFGGKGRELGSTWFADLGPPFGVMYCIRCECLPVHKKRRIVAKVQCRNIKNECPKPTCDEPILHPGRCCKSCPGDGFGLDTLQDIPPMTVEEEEKDARHFSSLLTGARRAPAAARFVLRRRSLHYALEEGGTAESAVALLLLDPQGSVLQELPLAGGARLAGRACGAWRRLPRDYRRMLREGKMTAALVYRGEQDPQLQGKIVSHGALSTEMFSSLMEAESDSPIGTTGWAGTAAITASAGATPSLHITLFFVGVLGPDEIADAPVIITLENTQDKNITILEEIRHIRKPSSELNVVELSSPVSTADLRLLARGRLALRVRGARGGRPYLRTGLRGAALPRLACDLFHAPLTAAPQQKKPPVASGLAWLHLSREGELVYNVQVDELNMMESPMITLMMYETNKRHMELESLTPFLKNGLATGFLDRMAPKVLEPLYSGDLVVNVATHSDDSVIRGRLVPRPIADPMDLNGPTLLKRRDFSQPAELVGLAWVSVDYECNLQWEIQIAGPSAPSLSLPNLELWLDMRPILAHGAPVLSRRLGTLETPEGALLALGRIDVQRLYSGSCELIVKEPISNTTLLRAYLRQMKIPDICMPQTTENEVPGKSSVPSHPNSRDNSIGDSDSCYQLDNFYEDGTQWTHPKEPCLMCSCLHGQVACDSVRCPPMSCDARSFIPPGECCPVCTNSTLQDVNTSSTRGCHLAGKFHSAGQSWHPYLPPEGFDTCTICTCDPKSLSVRCPRVPCPPLNCPDKISIRPDKKACCRVCPEIKPEVIEKSLAGELKDEGSMSGLISRQSADDILAAGGCRNIMQHLRQSPFPNGHEWHPMIHSLGEQKCVTCRCKDGNIKCDRKRCTRSMCNNQPGVGQRRRNHNKQATAQHQQKPQPLDECCQQTCRRQRRHQRHHRVRT